MKIYYPISVDLYNQYPLQVITAQQANIGRGVMLTLTANNAVLVPENESLFVYVKKPDATKVYADCVLSGNQVQIDFTQQMLAVPGMLEAELQLIDASGNNITTPIFLIDNQASNIDYAALESSDEFKAFVDALAEVEYYREHGLVGPPGEAATITVGDVEASAPGSAPQVTNSGTSQNAVLNFTLPRGEPGSVWYFGTAITGTETSGTVFPDSGIEDAKEYDKYVNTDTGNIYDCSMAGGASTAQWTYIGSIMGPAGATQIVFAAYSNFPETGEPGKIYVDTDTTDELVIWRWTGTEYVTTEHGALEMIADGLDPDESYVVNDYFIQGNKFRKVTTAFGPGEYDDSKTEVTTVAAELKSQNSKIEGLHSRTKTLIVDQGIEEKQNVPIPGYDSYRALMILLYGDGNNGITIFIPAVMYDISFPFTFYSSDKQNTIQATGYSVCVQGQIKNGTIIFSYLHISGWSGVSVRVYGIN